MTSAPGWMSRVWEIAGIAGMAVASIGAVTFAFAVGPWFGTLSDTLDVTAGAIDAVDSTIDVVDASLVVLSDTLVGVDGVLSQTSATLEEVGVVVLSTAGLLQDEIPGQVEAIQAAMDGLIDTANVVDGVLSALSFVGVDYDPEVPLDLALEDVNERLGDLSQSLSRSSADLYSLTVSVNRLTDEVGVVADSMADLEEQVGDSLQLIGDYRESAETARQVITDAAGRLEGQTWVVGILGVTLLVLLVPLFGMLWWVGRGGRHSDVE